MSIIESNRLLLRKKSTKRGRGKRTSSEHTCVEKLGLGLDGSPETVDSSRKFGYYAELSQARDVKELKSRITGIVNRLGFSDFTFIRLDSTEQIYASVLLTFPSQLCKTYCEERFHKRDMLIPFVREELKPIYLSAFYDYVLRAPVDVVMTRAIREIRRLNEDCGYFDAYHIPLVSRNGVDRVMFSVTEKGLSPIDFKLKMESSESTFQILAGSIDAIVTEQFPELLIERKEQEESIFMNLAPLRVLDALANNDLKVGQVADKLCISIVTANKHLESARKVLGVKTNHAAIRRAILKGLIRYDKDG